MSVCEKQEVSDVSKADTILAFVDVSRRRESKFDIQGRPKRQVSV